MDISPNFSQTPEPDVRFSFLIIFYDFCYFWAVIFHSSLNVRELPPKKLCDLFTLNFSLKHLARNGERDDR